MPMNKEKRAEYDRNRDKNVKKKYNRDYYLRNKQKINDRSKKWRENNKGYYTSEKWKEYNRKRYVKFHRKRKLLLVKLLGGKCTCCDESHPVCLDFHHLDPTKKEHNKEWMRKDFIKKIENNEILLLCSNCHRKEHNPDIYESPEEELHLCNTALQTVA